LLRNEASEYKEATRNADYDFLGINRYVAFNNNSLIGDEFTLDAPTPIMLQNVLKYQTFKRKPVAIEPDVPFENSRRTLDFYPIIFREREPFSTTLGLTIHKRVKLRRFLF